MDTLAIYTDFLEPDIIKKLTSNDLKIAVKPLSCVRLFDSTMMHAILNACHGSLFGSWEIEDFGDMMIRFKNTGLMVWDQRGNSINHDIRNLMSNYLRDHEPVIYKSAHKAALKEYGRWLERPVSGRSLFVAEEIFHLASLGQEEKLEPTLMSRLREYPDKFKDRNERVSQIGSLGEMLNNDEDLGGLTGLVPSLIETINTMKSMITGS